MDRVQNMGCSIQGCVVGIRDHLWKATKAMHCTWKLRCSQFEMELKSMIPKIDTKQVARNSKGARGPCEEP